MSSRTRQIACMSEEVYESFKPSQEYARTGYEKMYSHVLKKGRQWIHNIAAHLLVREDPNDYHWQLNSGYHKSQNYKTILKALEEDYLAGNILLMERTMSERTVLIADPIIYIRWAFDRGFSNIPEMFIEFLGESSISNEENNTLNAFRTVVKDGKESKQKRSHLHALHLEIARAYNESKDKSPRTIWNILKKWVDDGICQIIQEMSPWTEHNAKINWISHRNVERTMQRATFENYISKIKKS